MSHLELLLRAIQSEFGIAISQTNSREAARLRRRLYAEREAVRRNGSAEFDRLSILLRPGGEIWLVNRDRIHKPLPALPPSREIRASELPTKILARGRHRAGFI